VLGLCRRLLRHEQDAEDAFQAVFLVLARKAAAIRRRASLASWLHGVALRVARKARQRAARRAAVHELLDVAGTDDPERDVEGREIREVIDEEIARLPPRCREAFLRCEVEGKTHEEAARELGRPLGSMSRHLERARTLLRQQLTRRGVTLAATGST